MTLFDDIAEEPQGKPLGQQVQEFVAEHGVTLAEQPLTAPEWRTA